MTYLHCAWECKAHDGRVFEILALDRRGSPENPLAAADIEHKFSNVVADCVDSGRAERIAQLVRELDRLDSVSELIGLVATPVEL